MARPLSQKAERLMKRLGLSFDDILVIRFAVNVTVASTIIWIILRLFGANSPTWAIASMIAASDPEPAEAKKMFKARLINVLVGCAVGLLFLLIGGDKQWMLPVALGVTVLVSSYIVRVKAMWRQAPITAAIVIAASITYASSVKGLEYGLQKVAEVIFGCLIGVLVSLAMSKVWVIKTSPAVPEPSREED